MTSILSGRKKKKLMARRMGQMRPEIFCQVRTCLIHSLHLAFFLDAAYILYGKNRVWWTYITLGSDWYRVAPVECVAKMGKYIMTFLLSLSRLRFLTATVLKPQLSAPPNKLHEPLFPPPFAEEKRRKWNYFSGITSRCSSRSSWHVSSIAFRVSAGCCWFLSFSPDGCVYLC